MNRILCASVVGLLSLACGSSVGSADPMDQPAGPSSAGDPAVASSEVEVLHQFSAHGNEYKFLYAGPDAFLLSSTGPLISVALPELAEGGFPTLLETYLALAPEGDPPDPKLVDYHLEEARLLGRPDDSVLHAKLNLDAPIEKAAQDSLSACKNYAVSQLPTRERSWATATQGGYYSGLEDDYQTRSLTLPVAAAACNIGGTATVSYAMYSRFTGTLDWTYVLSGTLSVNSMNSIRWGTTSNAKELHIVANGAGSYQLTNAFYVR